MNSKIYYVVALVALGYLPFLKFSPFSLHAVSVLKLSPDGISYSTISEAEYTHRFQANESAASPIPKRKDSDSTYLIEGIFRWGAGTDSIRQRVKQLRAESSIFNKVFSELEHSEYPFYVHNKHLEQSIGEFSSLNGELRFSVDKMKDYFFDAAVIEEFVHAYQASFYDYAHGQFKKRDYLFALKDGDNNQRLRRRLELGFLRWEQFGTKQAYIESEAKIITYLIQNQAQSISIKDLISTDEYNAGAAARAYILPYLNKRNCTRYRRTSKMTIIDDFYIDYETFMRYQNAFIRHWKWEAPGSSYTRGKFRHRPEALQALSR